MTRSLWTSVAAVLGGLLLLALVRSQRAPGARVSSAPPAAAPAAGRELAPAPSPPPSREELVPAEPGACFVRGVVVAADSGLPLGATIAVGQRRVVAGADGAFRVLLRGPGPRELTARAPGFCPRVLPLELGASSDGEVDLGRIALEPDGAVTFLVLDAAGRPVRGAELRVLAGSPEEAAREPSLGTTDEHGVLRRALPRAAVVAAFLGERASPAVEAPSSADGPGGIGLVLADGSGRTLGLRQGATQAPLAGVRVRLEGVGFPRVHLVRTTGDDGRLGAPVPAGRYRVQLPHGVRPAGHASLEPLGERRGSLLDLGPGQVTWLDVEWPDDRWIALLDAATGAPVGPARGWLAEHLGPPFARRERWMPLPGACVSEDGDHRLRLGLLGIEGDEREAGVRLYAQAPGYRAAFLLDPARTIAPGETLALHLEAGRSLRLRVLTADGGPWPREVFLLDEEGWHVLGSGLPDGRGWLPPIDLDEGGLVLADQGQRSGRVLARLEEEDLLGRDEHTVVVAPLGRIVVAGAPPEARLLAYGPGVPVLEALATDGSIVFEDLLPGRYEVGTACDHASLAVREAQGLPTLPLELGPGALLEVSWDERWTPGAAFTGRVEAVGVDPGDLRVFPVSSVPGLRLATSVRQPSFPVADDGAFRIPPFLARVTRLDFAVLQPDGACAAVGTAAPGELATIRCARLRLELDGLAPGEDVWVTYRPQVPGAEVLQQIRRGRRGPGPLDLGSIAAATESLEVRCGVRVATFPLRLEPGGESVLRIELRD